MTIRIIVLSVLVSALSVGQQSDSGKSEQKYEGPSILSRDKSSIGERGGKLIDFRYYLDLEGVYDSNLSPVAVANNGTVANVGGNYGGNVGVGVLGSRTWEHDRLGVNYHGDYNRYANYVSGQDQFLGLNYSHAFSRHLAIDFFESAGSTYVANGYYTYLPLANSQLLGIPTNNLFDNRTNFLDSSVQMTWQATSRTSLSVGGSGFIVRQNSFALTGSQGYNLQATLARRLTRRQTASVSYGYGHYDYQRLYGNANFHQLSLGYSLALSRRLELAANIGGFVVNAVGLQTIMVDPAVAAIIGTSTVVTTFNRTYYAPSFGGRVTRTFNRASASLNYSLSVSPGNGVYLTSRANTATADYSYVGFRNLTVGANAGYSSLSSLGQGLGKYSNYIAGVGVTYRFIRDMHFIFRYDYRHYNAGGDFYRKNSDRVAIGVAYSPGDRPLAIW